MSKIKNGGLDQYGAGPFEQQQFGTVGDEGVNKLFDKPLSVLDVGWYGSYGMICHTNTFLAGLKSLCHFFSAE